MPQDAATPSTAYVALGSNLGDRRAMIDAALDSLRQTPGIEVQSGSSILETAPVGPVEQGWYLNAVVQLSTTLSPRNLLDRCLAIECDLGRDRSVEMRWGPRAIDLDLLLYDDLLIDEPGLRIPHPRLHERAFVLEPLAQIAPRVVLPGLGRSVECVRRQLLPPWPREVDEPVKSGGDNG